MSRLLTVIVVLLLAGAPPLLAQEVPLAGQDASPSGPTAPAALDGMVTEPDGHPLAQARVEVDSGQVTYTTSGGRFHIAGIPPGPHYVTISARGHNRGGKVIRFEPGRELSLRVSLRSNQPESSAPKPSPTPQTGTFYVQAHPYRANHHRYGVYHIEVYGYSDPSKHWSHYGYQGHDGPGLAITCSDAKLGETYVIRITWVARGDRRARDADDELNATFYRKFTSQWQTENIYNP